MKTYKLLLLLCPLLLLISFDSGETTSESGAAPPISYANPDNGAQEVPLILKEAKPLEFYIEQAELWWKVLEKDKKNEHAWFNYFKANRWAHREYNYKNTPELGSFQDSDWKKQSKYLKNSKDIFALVEENIPGTFMYYYLKVWSDPDIGEAKIPLLEKAYAINPEFYELYSNFVMHFEMIGDKDKRREFNIKWYKSKDFSENFLSLFYNVLSSTKENAAIITFGDNSLLAPWMLQDALNFREDVTIINIGLMIHKIEYRNRLFKGLGIPPLAKEYKGGNSLENKQDIVAYIVENKPEGIPLYFDLHIHNDIKKRYEDDLYLVGLSLEYSKTNIDNIAELKKNYNSKYLLDYISVKMSPDSYPNSGGTGWNYLRGISVLYEHYYQAGDLSNMQRMKVLGLACANTVGEGSAAFQIKQNVIDYFNVDRSE